MTQEIRKQAICSEETFFKSYKVLYEKPGYRETLDCVDCTIYCLLAERYNFFWSLEHHENQVTTRSGELAIRFSESKIAEYLQVSRNKVSLAIRKLEILGLIKAERTPGQASNYIVKDIPAEVSHERITKVKELLAQKKQRNKKYDGKNLHHIEQDPKLASYRASDDLLKIEQVAPAQNRAGNDDDLLKMNTGTCSKLSNHLLKINQVPAQNEYNNKIKINKDLNKNPERGSASSLDDTACPPAVTNNTNDGIQGEVAPSSKEGLSLPSEKDNAVSDREHTPVENTIVVTPPSNADQNNDGIEQREQSPSGGHQQPGIGNESETAATTQNLPEEKKEKTLREWLTENCKIRWVLDAVLSKIDGDQIMPREHTPDWDAMMQQVAAALPTLRDVLAKCGIHPDNLTTLERFCRDKNKPFTAETVIGTLCGPSAKDKLMVYILTEDYI